jgi:hypothetical protein
MKTPDTGLPGINNSTQSKHDSRKLVSILTLATGAAAMPQTSDAVVYFTDLSFNPGLVGWDIGYNDSFSFDLPGTAQFGFRRGHYTFTGFSTSIGTYAFYSQYVVAGFVSGASGGVQAKSGFAVPFNKGREWDQRIQSFPSVGVGVATAVYYPFRPTVHGRQPLNGYDHKYLSWLFRDTTQGGAARYGWVEVSLLMANFPVGPNVTIWGYAYDDAGNMLRMGEVPEPASGSLLALGALALGARGLRSWRRNKVAAVNS